MLAGVFVEVDMVARSLLAILLIALMSGVLRGIASLSLLSRVFDVAAALLDLMGIAGFGITGALVALIVRRHGRGFGHCRLHCACHRTTRGEHEGFFSIFRNRDPLDFPGDEHRHRGSRTPPLDAPQDRRNRKQVVSRHPVRNERPSGSKFSPPDKGNFRALSDLLPAGKTGKRLAARPNLAIAHL